MLNFVVDSYLADATDFVFPKTDIFSAPAALVLGSPDHGASLADMIVNLWLEGRFKTIIFSGYRGEAEAMSSAAIKAGLPQAVISLENKASNTPENIEFSLPLLSEDGIAPTKLIVFGKNRAERRCLMTLKKYLPDCKISFVPMDYAHVTAENWFRYEPFVEKIICEIKKCADYQERGHISVLSPKDRFTSSYLRELHDWLLTYSGSLTAMNSRMAFIDTVNLPASLGT